MTRCHIVAFAFQKEEEESRQREEAERVKQERDKHFQKEEAERMERKKVRRENTVRTLKVPHRSPSMLKLFSPCSVWRRS